MTEWDIQRGEEKKEELKKTLTAELNHQRIDISSIGMIEEKVFTAGVQIFPPERPPCVIHMITMDSFHSSAESTKPGNIRVNAIGFLESIGTGVMTFAGGLAYPWLYLVGFLLLWKQLWDCATIKIEEKESKILWSMWELKKEDKEITFDNIFNRVNVISGHYNLPKLKKGEVEVALRSLEEISAIEKTIKGGWRIIEWIQVKYR